MGLVSFLRTQVLEQWHGLPLPALASDTSLSFQSWHNFNPHSGQWDHSHNSQTVTADQRDPGDTELHCDSKLVLVTWNIDSATPAPETRISAIISHIKSLTPPVDIIFLQEVSRPALLELLTIPWVRDNWFSSEADTTQWGKQSFASVTLLSRVRFGYPNYASNKITLGPVWRVKYASRFERNALCCDILLPTSSHPLMNQGRIRLVNVHLDSLPINPSLRPRQLSTAASFLHATGRGLVAGDFNPVLPEDDGLINTNGLTDAWVELRSGEPGFTWGVDGEQPFPPNRLDRIAITGLRAHDIRVIPPGSCSVDRNIYEYTIVPPSTDPSPNSKSNPNILFQWSDHSGVVFSMTF
ncbi:hypothetical protein FQN57_001683 [Myotisia sp. PD_48]|nr:hypothetical protein FQN57_001683 [Myotisia sp. PD_48]